MAVLTLNQLWINLVATGEAVYAWSSDRSQTRVGGGDVRGYAGGRQRAITSAGVRKEFPFRMRDVTADQLTLLESWFGQTVVVRDHRGQKFYGVFFNLSITERKVVDLYDVGMTLITVTYDENV